MSSETWADIFRRGLELKFQAYFQWLKLLNIPFWPFGFLFQPEEFFSGYSYSSPQSEA